MNNAEHFQPCPSLTTHASQLLVRCGRLAVFRVVTLAIILISVSTPSSAATTSRSTVMGSMSCNSWANDRKQAENGKGAEILSDNWAKGWVLGYLSALNVSLGGQKDILAAVDADTVFLWVDRYCAKNPNKPMYDVLGSLVLELAKMSK